MGLFWFPMVEHLGQGQVQPLLADLKPCLLLYSLLGFSLSVDWEGVSVPQTRVSGGRSEDLQFKEALGSLILLADINHVL